MLGGRFLPIVAVLAIAGSLARKQPVPATAGTFPTGTPLFAGLLVGVILIVVALTYLRPRARPDPGAAGASTLRKPAPSSTGRSCWAARDSVLKLDPRRMARNPVMFVVEAGSVLVTVLAVVHPSVFSWLVAAWLWFTVLFANFAEAVAEGRGKAQADELRKTRSETIAHRRGSDGSLEDVPSSTLKVGDKVVVSAGEVIPADGTVIEGSRASTSRRSRASPRPSSESPAGIARRSRAGRACCRTRSRCASRRRPAKASSIG